MFDYDWFFGTAYAEQREAAKLRLALRKHPEADPEHAVDDPQVGEYLSKLDCRTLIYLRDGFSYEVREIITTVRSKAHLTLECEPADELYKVGVFVVAVPFEDIARVEVFAAHADQKPENLPMITGFMHGQRRGGEVLDGEVPQKTTAP
jgi:hypothetical protein